jgi:Suppressor of fused protein (SUFU)
VSAVKGKRSLARSGRRIRPDHLGALSPAAWRSGKLPPESWVVALVAVKQAVRDLYIASWGEPSRRARFDVGEFGIDVLKWSAEVSPEGVALYATVGASCRPLEGTDPGHRIEFFTGLLPEQDGIASSFAALGLYSAREGEALDHGHTVPASRPLWPGCGMRTYLVMRAREGFLPALDLSDGLHVEFLQALPIFESEREYKVQHGPDALIRLWEENRVPFWDPTRPDSLIP